MTATDVSTLKLPEGLISHLRVTDRSDVVLAQRIGVDFDWWNERLGRYGVPGGPIGSADGSGLTRADVFAVGTADPHRLLWLSLAWGAGNRRRLCEKRIETVAGLGDTARDLLTSAAAVASTNPSEGFRTLAPSGKPAIPFLGAAFFSKYLYFASGTPAQPPAALILDSRVATSLKRAGWQSLVPTGGWASFTYQRYLELVDRWANEAIRELERPVAGDEIEFWLFHTAR